MAWRAKAPRLGQFDNMDGEWLRIALDAKKHCLAADLLVGDRFAPAAWGLQMSAQGSIAGRHERPLNGTRLLWLWCSEPARR